MAIADSPWRGKQVAEACRITPTAASRHVRQWQARARRICEALLSLEPAMREHDLATCLLEVMRTGAELATLGEPQMRQQLRLLAAEARRRSPGP